MIDSDAATWTELNQPVLFTRKRTGYKSKVRRSEKCQRKPREVS